MLNKDSFEQLKSFFENRDWQRFLKLCKKLHYNDQNDIVALYGMLISYTVSGDTEKAKQIIENNIEKFNPLNLKKLKNNDESVVTIYPDIKEINNIILAREIAKKIKKERMVSFIDDFFNVTLPVAIRLFQIKEEKKDNDLQINYFVKTEKRKAELSRLGIDAQLLPYNQNEISEDLALKLLKSKIVVIETYQLMLPSIGLLNALISGSIRFQLWHGLPVKKIGVATNFGEKVNKDINLMLSIIEDSVKTDYIVTQTDNKNINDAYLSAFPNAKLVPTGDPRIDVLFDETLSIGEEYISSLKKWSLENKNKKKILLMFTFRDFVEEDAKHLIEINSLIDTLSAILPYI